jgi:hypothetical protein
MGGERLPPKLVLLFALLSAVIAAGWIVLSLDSDVLTRWVQWGVAAVSLVNAGYYAALFVHRRRRG